MQNEAMHAICAAKLALSLAISLLVVSSARGQTTFGSITGTVTDRTGAMIPSARVTVHNVGTGVERVVSTSAGGVFNVPNLDLGRYRVIVTAPGFARYERSGLVLSANQVLNVDAELELDIVATITEVSAAAPAIDASFGSTW